MKKVLWAVFVSLVAVPTLFAQTNLQLENAIKREVAKKVNVQQKAVTDKAVLIQLQVVRNFVKKSKTEDVSLIMQSVVMLADSFFDYVKNGGTDVRLLVREIETPMEVGWSHTEVFVVSHAIDQFTEVLSHEWGSKEPTDELMAFGAILKQYPQMTNREVEEYKRLKDQLERVRQYVANASEGKTLVAMQSLVYLADAYFDSYAKNPAEKTERFEAKNPELAASVAREIEHEGLNVNGALVKVSDYILLHLPEAEQAWKSYEPIDELNTFRRVLRAAN